MLHQQEGSTPMDGTIPRLEDQLPDVFEFVRTAALQIEAGQLRDGDELVLSYGIHDEEANLLWLRTTDSPN